MNNLPYDESDLLRRVSEGNREAFRVLYGQYWKKLYSVAFAMTHSAPVAEDLTQELFARIWEKREELAGVQQFSAYLYRMARNQTINHLRKVTYVPQEADYFESILRNDEATPGDELDFKELQSAIQEAITSLTPQLQEVFRLNRFEGLSYEQIAARTGLSPLSVGTYMKRAHRQLRAYLDEHHSLSVIIWILLFLEKK